MPLLSIIIPIYNTEKYLRECLESILSQSFKNYELILVDDGSTDGCSKICEEYKKKDSRIIFIKKENGGISDARNVGLETATGKYILFCDSDDTMVKNALKKVMTYVNKNDFDVTMCTYILNFENENVTEKEEINFNEKKFGDDVCAIMSEYMDKIVPWSACRNVIRRKIITNNYIRFNKHFLSAEDCDFYFNVCAVSERFGSINQPIINYRADRQNSTTNTYNKENVESISIVYDKWVKYYKAMYGIKSKKILSAFSNHYYYLIARVANVDNNEDIIEVFERHKNVLKYVTGWKKKIIRIYYYIFGIKRGMELFRRK